MFVLSMKGGTLGGRQPPSETPFLIVLCTFAGAAFEICLLRPVHLRTKTGEGNMRR